MTTCNGKRERARHAQESGEQREERLRKHRERDRARHAWRAYRGNIERRGPQETAQQQEARLQFMRELFVTPAIPVRPVPCLRAQVSAQGAR